LSFQTIKLAGRWYLASYLFGQTVRQVNLLPRRGDLRPNERLAIPLGEAMYTLRAIRQVKPDPIPDSDLELLLEAAGRAPSSGNQQPWHFVVVLDPAMKAKLQALYKESWWNWFRSTGQDKLPEPPPHSRAAMKLTEELHLAPVLILACVLTPT